jgi:hypothetical protein
MTDEPDPGRRTVAGPYPATGEPDDMWIRLDESLLADPRYLALSIEERAGAVAVLIAGLRSDPPGTWPSPDVLQQSLPRWVPESTVPSMVASGMLDATDGLAVAVTGVYSADTPGAERQRAYRERRNARRNVLRHALVSSREETKSPESPLPRRGATLASIAPALRAPAREGGEDDWHAIALVIEDVTQRPYALVNPDSKMGEMVLSMLAKHGAERVAGAMRRAGTAAGPMPTVAQVVFGAGNMLDAIPRVRPDCEVCYNMGVTAKGRRPCPDCGRSEPDPRAN